MSGSRAENGNDETDEDGAQQLLEDKRCAICQEIMVNACRVSCGHSFCRQCIDAQLNDPSLEGRNQRCVICDAKIDDIQNCNELDEEINVLFSRMSTKTQLDRAGVKAEKIRKENEPAPAATGNINPNCQNNPCAYFNPENEEPSNFPDDFTDDQYEPQSDSRSWYRTQDIGEDYEGNEPTTCGEDYSEDEWTMPPPPNHHNFEYLDEEDLNRNSECSDSGNVRPPVVVHETITFHRTRVLNADNNNSNIPESAPLDSHTFCHHHSQPPLPPPIPMPMPYYNNLPPPGYYFHPHPQQYNNYQQSYPYPFQQQQQYPQGTLYGHNSQYHDEPFQSPVPEGHRSFLPVFTDYDDAPSGSYEEEVYEFYEPQTVIPDTLSGHDEFRPNDQSEYGHQTWDDCFETGRNDGQYGSEESDFHGESVPQRDLNIQINVNIGIPNDHDLNHENTDDSDSDIDSTMTYPRYHEWDNPRGQLGGYYQPIRDGGLDL